MRQMPHDTYTEAACDVPVVSQPSGSGVPPASEPADIHAAPTRRDSVSTDTVPYPVPVPVSDDLLTRDLPAGTGVTRPTVMHNTGAAFTSNIPVKTRAYIPPSDADMLRDIDTLKLCGSLKRYYVTKTPMIAVLTGTLDEPTQNRANRVTEDAVLGASRERKVIGGLRHLNLPRPPFLVQFRAAMQVFGWAQIALIVLLIVGLCVRSSRTTAFTGWSQGVLEGLSVGILLLSPGLLPLLAVLGEWFGTAYVLAYLEAAVVRARWKLRLDAHRRSLADPQYVPKLKRKARGAGPDTPTDGHSEDELDDDDDAESSSDEEAGGKKRSTRARYEEPDDYRPKHGDFSGPSFDSISSQSWRRLEWRRKLHYFKRCVFHCVVCLHRSLS